MPQGKTETELFNPLKYPISLMEPLRLTDVRSWHMHIPFAFTLIQMVQPRVLVELGTHKGDSYCAFCQAVDTLGLESNCYAVDTWEGDEHAGFYSSEVLDELRSHHDPRYARFSTLLQMTFDQAADNFKAGSIDLLHIDGLHTYEAVKHDFENWLPKMSERGLVLLHDVNVHEKDFGVWAFWEEIKARYPLTNFEFKYGNGLGLVALGSIVPEPLEVLFQGGESVVLLTKYFSWLGEKTARLSERLWHLDNVERDRAKVIAIMNENILLNESLKVQLKAMEQSRDQIIKEHDQVIKERSRLAKELSESQAQLQRLQQFWENQSKELYRQPEQVQSRLQSQLEQVQSELRALKSTNTVRFSRAAGVMVKSSRQLLRDIKGSPIIGGIDIPTPNSTIEGSLKVSGWAVARRGIIQQVEVLLDNYHLGKAHYGVMRPDVVAARPLQVAADCGFTGEFSLEGFGITLGSKTLTVLVSDNRGNVQEYSCPVQLQPPPKKVSSHNNLTAHEQWIKINEPGEAELIEQREQAQELGYKPLISLITPVYNPSPAVLQATIESVLRQTYSNWELCLVDGASHNPAIRRILAAYAAQDSRIRVKFLDENLGIAKNSNEAIRMANGEFIALLDHDDEIAPNALYENALLLNSYPEADMIYSDEDKLNPEGQRCEPFFKPDWSPDLFRSQMYTCHLGVYRAGLIKDLDGFREGFEGAQDYDLVLRLVERTKQIYHIPKLLYHWRMTEVSTALNPQNKLHAQEAQVKAVQEHCERLGMEANAAPGQVQHTVRVKYQLEHYPLVSIIIPTRDQVTILRQAIDSLSTLTTYPNYEIIVVNNDSVEPSTLEYFETLVQKARTRVIDYPGVFNFSAINNFAATQAEGELLLFLNNDIEVINPDWLEALVEHAMRPEVGAVGARLLYPNGSLQHGGVIMGIGSVAGHSHKYLPVDEAGYFSRAKVIQNFSAVTGACILTKAELFHKLGGFNSQVLPVAFNDVDYCLRLRERGYLIVWTPYAELIHHESISRGTDEAPEKAMRFHREGQYMRRRWPEVIKDDPYYNPNLTLETEGFAIATFARYRQLPAHQEEQFGKENLPALLSNV